jgi:hypothetical protein
MKGRNWMIGLNLLFIVAFFYFPKLTAVHAQLGCGGGGCQDICNYVDGSNGGHHGSGTCNYNAACTCWCVTEKCASSKCGVGTIEQCQTQEACQMYASGQLSFCLNASGC